MLLGTLCGSIGNGGPNTVVFFWWCLSRHAIALRCRLMAVLIREGWTGVQLFERKIRAGSPSVFTLTSCSSSTCREQIWCQFAMLQIYAIASTHAYILAQTMRKPPGCGSTAIVHGSNLSHSRLSRTSHPSMLAAAVGSQPSTPWQHRQRQLRRR